MTCRGCGGPTRLLPGRADLTVGRCTRCRLVSGWPAAGESPSYDDHYARITPAMLPVRRYIEWLETAERRIGRGRLIEVGAGAGAFARAAAERGWAVQATEVSRSAGDTLLVWAET